MVILVPLYDFIEIERRIYKTRITQIKPPFCIPSVYAKGILRIHIFFPSVRLSVSKFCAITQDVAKHTLPNGNRPLFIT